MNTVTKDEINKAQKVNIVDYLMSKGVDLQKQGHNYWRLVEHDSLIINNQKNFFVWNSRNEAGNLIDFLQVYYKYTFVKAVNEINGTENLKKHDETNFNSYVKEFDTDTLNTIKDKDNVINNYLNGVRGISFELIDLLKQRNYIKLDDHNNIVFLWTDNCKVVGADRQGTIRSKKPFSNGKYYFKKIDTTTEKYSNFGFNLQVNGTDPENLVFFESPVDLLSYLELNKGQLKNTWLISMNGLKINTVANVILMANQKLQTNNKSLKSVRLAVDNDNAGLEFVEKLNNYEVVNSDLIITDELPSKAENEQKMDWNKLLLKK